MLQADVARVRDFVICEERKGKTAGFLFRYEEEHYSRPHGVSVIVAVHNGEAEIRSLLVSLRLQSCDPKLFEVIFALNGCTDGTRELLEGFRLVGINMTILEFAEANVSTARNSAIDVAQFRYATFVDHDDRLSRDYLSESLGLADYRSVVVSNIVRLEGGVPTEDIAQVLVEEAFVGSRVVPPEHVATCYRCYTLNAIKLAPTYMMKRIRFDRSLEHCEDVKYWRDLFVAFLPITVKTPTRRDLYFRTVRANSLSRKSSDSEYQGGPRRRILAMLIEEGQGLAFGSPGWIFDRELSIMLRGFIRNLGV